MVFEKYDEWRNHPKLNPIPTFRNPRNWGRLWPGAGWGVAAFGVFVILEKVGVIPSSHGHHDHHGDHGHKKDHH